MRVPRLRAARGQSRLADSRRAGCHRHAPVYVQTKRYLAPRWPIIGRIGQRHGTTMKATEIRILPALDPGESYIEPVFLLVETTLGDDGDTITRIDQISRNAAGGNGGWKITTIGQFVPLTHSAAREWAVSYAASRGIPVVYERDDSQGASYAATLNAGAAASTSGAPASRPSK